LTQHGAAVGLPAANLVLDVHSSVIAMIVSVAAFEMPLM